MITIPQNTTKNQNSPKSSNSITNSAAVDANLGKEDSIAAAQKKRSKKFVLLAFAKRLLIKYDVRNTKGNFGHKTRFCHAYKAYNAESVIIKLSPDDTNSEASYSGIFQCGSIWSCPICAPKIAADKGKEIGTIIDGAIENGLMLVMVSLTARHDIGMSLKAFKKSFKAAWRDFTNRRSWKRFKKHFGVLHWIANREVLYGENGWHYHMHFVLLIKKSVIAQADALENIQAELESEWLHVLARHDLEGLPGIGLKVTAHGDIKAAYLVKLGLSQSEGIDDLQYEIAGGMNKARGRTVWDLLRLARYGDVAAEKRYVEYVREMQGDNWITTSHGLKDLAATWETEEPEEPVSTRKPLKPWVSIPDYWVHIIHLAGAHAEILDLAAITRHIPHIRTELLIIRDDLIDQGIVPKDHKAKSFGIDRVRPILVEPD